MPRRMVQENRIMLILNIPSALQCSCTKQEVMSFSNWSWKVATWFTERKRTKIATFYTCCLATLWQRNQITQLHASKGGLPCMIERTRYFSMAHVVPTWGLAIWSGHTQSAAFQTWPHWSAERFVIQWRWTFLARTIQLNITENILLLNPDLGFRNEEGGNGLSKNHFFYSKD